MEVRGGNPILKLLKNGVINSCIGPMPVTSHQLMFGLKPINNAALLGSPVESKKFRLSAKPVGWASLNQLEQFWHFYRAESGGLQWVFGRD